MRYSLCILSAPDTDSAKTALAFAHALVTQGHSLYRVFFQGEGVRHCEQPDAMQAHSMHCPEHTPFSVGGLILLAEAASTSDRLIEWGE